VASARDLYKLLKVWSSNCESNCTQLSFLSG